MVLKQIPDGPYKPLLTVMLNEYIGRPELSKEVVEKGFVEMS